MNWGVVERTKMPKLSKGCCKGQYANVCSCSIFTDMRVEAGGPPFSFCNILFDFLVNGHSCTAQRRIILNTPISLYISVTKSNLTSTIQDKNYWSQVYHSGIIRTREPFVFHSRTLYQIESKTLHIAVNYSFRMVY